MNSFKRLMSIIALLLVHSASLKAQIGQRLNLPAILPPSPAVQNFMRYGEVPVDYSTGVPSISIPLYTVTSQQLSFPISLSYHASGIKVQDKASTVGLGWVLNSGGYIAQTVLGGTGVTKPTYTNAWAFRSSRPGESSSLGLRQDWFSAMYYEFTGRDWASDRFSYQLPGGESGVFRYTYDTGKLIKLPYNSVKIAPNSVDSVAGGGNQFVITDAKGVSYNFKDNHTKSVATYYISSMVSADKTDTIRFTYRALRNEFYTANYTSVLQLYCLPSAYSSSYVFEPKQRLNNSLAPSYYTEELVPDSIISRTTVVVFNVANDRLDITPVAGKQRVTGISIYRRNDDSKPIKSVTFSQDYFGASARKNQRLRLNGVTSRGSDGMAVESHSFVYETSKELPPYAENMTHIDSLRVLFREDYWGYYNGKSGSNMVPREFVPTRIPQYPSLSTASVWVDGLSMSDRNPDSLFAKAAMLKEIHYPTGGKTVFDFEPNRAADAYFYDSGWTVPEYVGGFRVRAIKNYLDDGTLAGYKYYRYGPGKTRQIRAELFTQVRRDVAGVGPIYISDVGIVGYPNLIITSSSHVPLTCDNGPPVFYSSVAEYFGGMNSNAGKTLYTYQIPPETANPNGGFELPVYEGPYFRDRGNYSPKLMSKKVYKRLGNGSYFPLKESITGYTDFLGDTYHMGMKTTQLSEYDNAGTASGDYPGDGIWSSFNYDYNYRVDGQDGAGPGYYLAVFDVNATQDLSLPTQTAELTYDSSDSTKYVAKTSSITYGNLAGYTLGSPRHTEPTQTLSSESDGDTRLTMITYPADNSSIQPYNTMVDRNILTPVIEEKSYKTSVSNFLQSVKTDYSFWDSSGQPTSSATNAIYPKLVSSKKGSGSYEPRVEYSNYDIKGNALDVRKASGPHVSYVYDRLKVNPVAQITNAAIKNVFYESFEDGVGNSAPDDSKTGHYSSTNGINRSLSGLDAGTYTLSYWSKSTTTWVLNMSTVTVPGSTALINLTGQIDDVRFYPSNAQMVTFTYDPLVGQTSATDTKNQVTYYQYDTFGRLKTIRDKDKNVVKRFCYNYKGQATDCFAPDPPPQPIIYARIEQSNYNEGVPGSYESDYWVYNTATLTVRFYANAACTIPYTLTAAMAVKVNSSYTIMHDMLGDYVYGQSAFTISAPSGVSSYSLGMQTLSSRRHFYDPGSSAYWDDYYWYDYEVVPQDGGIYTPI